MVKEISSLQNDLIKKIIQLQDKSRIRKQKGLFVIEGQREVSLAISGGYDITHLLYCKDIIDEKKVDQFLLNYSGPRPERVSISLKVYQKIAHRKKTEGIVAIAKYKSLDLNQLTLRENSLILVAEASEKPGNMGALLRTADAANLDAVIIANPITDLYNPNIIRSSVGCVFTNQIALGSTTEILKFLKENDINIFTAALDERSIVYDQINYKPSCAIVVGTEATGLSEQWLEETTENIIIPMQGKIDSLNVSVSAAIVIFEAKRQRGF